MISVDATEFERALAQYLKVSKSSLPDVLNRKAFFISRGALNRSKKASRADLTKDVGTPGRPKPLAWKIGNARISQQLGKRSAPQKAAKEPPYWTRDQLDERVRSMVRSRRRSIGFHRAGWKRAIIAFGKATGYYERVGGPKVARDKAGYGKPANARNWSPVAAIEYAINQRGLGGGLEVPPHIERAFGRSWRKETRNMARETADRMQREANRYNA